jgi:hypothetical protein
MASQSMIRWKFPSYPREPFHQTNHVFSIKALLSEVGNAILFYSYRCGGSYYMYT